MNDNNTKISDVVRQSTLDKFLPSKDYETDMDHLLIDESAEVAGAKDSD